MNRKILAAVEASSLKSDVPSFDIGDTVDVHTRILEGEKERVQIFNGVVIARSAGLTSGPSPPEATSTSRSVRSGNW